MEKEFIPYEQALELKELGFDEPCFSFFYKKTPMFGCCRDYPNKQDFLERPTYSQAFRWFREKYNLFHEIQIDKTTDPKFCFSIFKYEHFENYEEIRIGEWYLYRTQEEAELECLKKLIQIVKTK